ncbi:MAG: hypothetical protein ACI9DK_001532 [Vicingaceae bacterium]|jgi:hypothetical protein
MKQHILLLLLLMTVLSSGHAKNSVDPCPITASASSTNINVGQSSILSYTGCVGGTLTWDNSLGAGNNITVSPATTTKYIATCQYFVDISPVVCTSEVTITVAQCSIGSYGPYSVEEGNSTTILVYGCDNGTVTWDNGISTIGDLINISPVVNTIYKATCTPTGGGNTCDVDNEVIVYPSPIISASSTNINTGQSTTLTNTGCTGGTLTWDNVGPGNIIVVSPTTTTEYTARCVNNSNPLDVRTKKITVNVTACIIVQPLSFSIDEGESATLTYGGCTNGTVTWDNGISDTGKPISVSPAVNTTYKATCTPTGGGNTCSVNIDVIVKPCPIIMDLLRTINAGQSTTISNTGCTNGTLTWDIRITDTGNSVVVSPAESTEYTVECIDNSNPSNVCFKTVVVVVLQCAITRTGSITTIKLGDEASLEFGGCSNGTVTWSTGGVEVGPGNNFKVSPTVNTTYTATCTPNGGGNTCSFDLPISILSCPITVSATSETINAGQISILSYTGCTNGTLTWDNSLGSGNNIVVSPTTTTKYTASCVNNTNPSEQCTSEVTINVTQCIISSETTEFYINQGESVTLNYSGCSNGTVTWDNGISATGNDIRVSPTANTTYKATCAPTDGGNSCSLDFKIFINACPITASALPAKINAGQSTTLTYTGCEGGTVTWFYVDVIGNGNNLSVSPNITTEYTAQCVDINNPSISCTSKVTVTVEQCNIMVSQPSIRINIGTSATLTYIGCTNGTVAWNNGEGSGNNISVSPTTETTYTATCSPTGGGTTCSVDIIVIINGCPIITLAAPANINPGQSSTLSYLGCTNGTVTWDNGAGSGNNVSVSPSSTTIYTATCRFLDETSPCTSQIEITVVPCGINTIASAVTINSGQSSTLSYTGCIGGTVTWNNGAANGNGVSVSPTITTTYTATCTPAGIGSTPCISQITVNVTQCTVNATANPTSINAGQSSTLSHTGCTGGTVIWNDGTSPVISLSVSPLITTVYTATCTPAGLGSTPCTSQVTITTEACTIIASATPISINPGGKTTLSYTGCLNGTVTWSNGDSGNNVEVSPQANTKYTATCAPTGGAINCTDEVTVEVLCGITANAFSTNINSGQSVILYFTGCSGGSVVWDNGAGNGNNVTVSPIITTTYTATCTPSGGGTTCTSDITINVAVCAINATADPINITAGQLSVLSYTGCTGGSVAWNNGAGTGNSITVTPSTTTTYIATCTPTDGGTNCTSQTTVTVAACAVTATAVPTAINEGQSSTLSYTGCSNGTVTWNNGTGTGNNISVSPTTSTTYTATCTTSDGGTICTSQTTVTVINCNLVAAANPLNINPGQNTILSYSGCSNGTVTWNNGAGTGNNISVSPTTTTTYTAICTPTDGGTNCTSQTTVTVAACAVNAAATPSSISLGQSSILSYTGCTGGSVAWNNGAGTGNNVSVSLITTTTYTATCTPSGGGATCTSDVTINVAACAVNASTNPAAINAGQTSVLSYTGCTGGSVAWNNGAGTGNNVTVSPTTTTTYTATCTPSGGGPTCTSNVTINVASCSILASASQITTLAGQNITLSYSGCQNGTVTWNNGAGSGNNVSVSPTKSITYIATCNFSSAFNCASQVAISVNPLPINIIYTNSKQPNCTNEKSGNIEIRLNRGVANNEVTVRLGISKNNTEIGVYFFSGTSFKTPDNLDAGSYSLLIQTFTSSGEIASQTSGQINIVDRDQVTFSLTKADVKCFGGQDGAIEIVANGGTGNYFYEKNGLSNNPFNNINKHDIGSVRADSYVLKVRDSFGCGNTSQTITVNSPSSPLALSKVSQKDPRGFETRDGIAIVSIAGGTPNYQFEWTDESGKNYGSGIRSGNQNQNNTLRGGEYTVKAFDANYAIAVQKSGCFAEFKFNLIEPPIIEAQISVSNEISCFGKKDGSITINAKGGVPFKSGYIFSLKRKDNIPSSYIRSLDDFENLPSTGFILTVTDSNDVFREFEYFLKEPEKLKISLLTTKNLICYGDSNGEFAVKPSGGKSPYTFNWSNGFTGENLSNLMAGKYVGILSDLNGCKSDVFFNEIIQPEKFVATMEVINPSCFYKCDGSITATLSGGIAPYNYSWEGSEVNSNPLINLCGSKNFIFRALDSNKCTLEEKSSIVSPPNIDINLNPLRKLCEGQSILLDASNVAAKAYLWKAPNGSVSTNPKLETKQFGIYSVTLFDAGKCEFKAEVLVEQIKHSGTVRFASSTEVPINEPIVILDLSNPLAESVEWLLPKEAILDFQSNDKLQIRLNQLGEYYVGIKAKFLECELFQNQKIIVVDYLPETISINRINNNLSLKVFPNPNIGEFEVGINFDTPTDFKLKLINLSNPDITISERNEKGKLNYLTKMEAKNLPTGTYLISLETKNEKVSTRVIVIN